MPAPLPALPPDEEKIRSLSELLLDLSASLEGEEIPLRRIVEALHERGFGVLVFFMAFPMALPIPKPPGVTAVLGLPLLLLTVQMAIGRHTVWVPESVLSKTIARARLVRLIEALMPWLLRVEKFIRPRMGFMTKGMFSRLAGLAGTIMSTAVFLPFPGFNTIPSMSLCLLGIGDVMRDGLAVLIGALLGVAWIVTLGLTFAFIGVEGYLLAKDWVISLL